jgi:probable phosphoglycerate mutase
VEDPSPRPQDSESGQWPNLPVARSVSHQRPYRIPHKATLRLIISSLLGFDARGYRDRLDQSPACLNVLDFKDPVRARLMLFNDVSHYAREPRRPEANLSRWWDPPGI